MEEENAQYGTGKGGKVEKRKAVEARRWKKHTHTHIFDKNNKLNEHSQLTLDIRAARGMFTHTHTHTHTHTR